MKPLTSIADFYFQAKTDKRYEKLLIHARKSSYTNTGIVGSYEEALVWMGEWIIKNQDVYAKTNDCSCCVMVRYINSTLERMKEGGLI